MTSKKQLIFGQCEGLGEQDRIGCPSLHRIRCFASENAGQQPVGSKKTQGSIFIYLGRKNKKTEFPGRNLKEQ